MHILRIALSNHCNSQQDRAVCTNFQFPKGSNSPLGNLKVQHPRYSTILEGREGNLLRKETDSKVHMFQPDT
jgi:hypothetical protein